MAQHNYNDDTIFDAERRQLEELDKSNDDIMKQMRIPTLPAYDHKLLPWTETEGKITSVGTDGQVVRDMEHNGDLWTFREDRLDIPEDSMRDAYRPVGISRCRVSLTGGMAYTGGEMWVNWDKFYTIDKALFGWDPPHNILVRGGGHFQSTFRLIVGGDDDSRGYVILDKTVSEGGFTLKHFKSLTNGMWCTVNWTINNDIQAQGSYYNGLPHGLRVQLDEGGNIQAGSYMDVARIGGSVMEDLYAGAGTGSAPPDPPPP